MTREGLLTMALMWTWGMGAGLVHGILRTKNTKAQRANWMIGVLVGVTVALWPIAVPMLAILDKSGMLKRGR